MTTMTMMTTVVVVVVVIIIICRGSFQLKEVSSTQMNVCHLRCKNVSQCIICPPLFMVVFAVLVF